MSDSQPKTREQIVQEWLIGDVEELFKTGGELIDQGVKAKAALEKALPELRAIHTAVRNSIAAYERTAEKADQNTQNRLAAFENSLTRWAGSFRLQSLAAVAVVAFFAGMVGTVAGAFIITALR